MKRFLPFAVLLVTSPCWAPVNPSRLNIKTQDGTVNTYPYQARFTNGTVTDNADGTVSIASGSSGGGGGTSVKAPISFTFDGGGIVISSAITSLAIFYEMPYSATVSSYTFSCDTTTASISLSVSSQTFSQFATGSAAGSICASACPSLSNANRKGDGTLTGWTTSLSTGDYVIADLVGTAPSNAKRCVLQVQLQ